MNNRERKDLAKQVGFKPWIKSLFLFQNGSVFTPVEAISKPKSHHKQTSKKAKGRDSF